MFIAKLLRKARNIFYTYVGYKTIGVRGIVVQDGKVLLVKHTYLPGWYHVGGGVEKGETPCQAMVRELQEEVGITCLEPPKLFNVYYNNMENRDDYIIFYSITCSQQTPVRCNEIEAAQWFPLTHLPDAMSPATKRRIDAFIGACPETDTW